MVVRHLIAVLVCGLLLAANGQFPPGGGDEAIVPTVAEAGLSFPPVVKPEDLKSCGTGSLGLCADGEICARDVRSNDEVNDGVCAPLPVGGVAVPSDVSDFPHPLAYFPLSGGSTSSWPLRHYSGFQTNVSWIADPKFGVVAHCKDDESSLIVLPNVPFGHKGGLTVNLWMKKDKKTSLKGSAYQYIFSVAALVNARLGEDEHTVANQMHIYIPESPHSAEGLVRVIIQDSDDGGSTFFMDSDGEVGRPLFAPKANPKHSELDDGKWHMVTVTTLDKKKRKGFRIFIDGKLVAETPKEEGVHGGHPFFADGDIFLCGRNDQDPDRHFDGAVAQLSLFDKSLSESQIKKLYKTIKSGGSKKVSGLDFAREVEKESVDISDEDLIGAIAQEGSGDLNKFRIEHFAAQAKYCRASTSCGEDEACAAIPSAMSEAVLKAGNQEQGTGVCARIPKGGLPNASGLAGVPLPVAFFPLTGGDTRSWPVPEFAGIPMSVGLKDDDVFGSVYHCSQANLSVLAIDDIEYGQNGAFALNVWFRATNLTGDLFQYFISIDNDAGAPNTVWGEQLNVYIGETEHVLFGVIRTIYKDEDDTDEELYVDSDGLIGVTDFIERTPSVKIQDGNWHMYTFTTNPPGEEGYKVYVDGIIAGEVDAEKLAGTIFEATGVPGGNAFTPNGPLFLCGRQDLHPERHFEGQIAHLTLYDEALTQDDIFSIYNSINQKKLAKSRKKNVPPTYPPPQDPSPLFPALPILPIEELPFGVPQPTQGQVPATPATSGTQGTTGLPVDPQPSEGPVLTVSPEGISTSAPTEGTPQDPRVGTITPTVIPPTSQGPPQTSTSQGSGPTVTFIPEESPAEGAPAPATQPTAPVVPGPTGSGLPGTTAPQAAPSKPAGHVDDLD